MMVETPSNTFNFSGFLPGKSGIQLIMHPAGAKTVGFDQIEF